MDASLLKTEIGLVHRELTVFRDELLRVLLSEPLSPLMPEHVPDFVRERSAATSNRLSEWQSAVTSLADFLPINSNTSKPNAEHFDSFMFTKATPNFTVSVRGLRWKISLFIPVDWKCDDFWPQFLPAQETAVDRERNFLDNLPQIKRRLMKLSVLDSDLLNGLSFLLPLIADVDPAFVKLAMDPQTWRTLVESNADLTESDRRKMLESIEHGHFRHATNNALLHVFAGLGNNRFLELRDYLDHPCLYGSYAGLMPHYLFALLFQKVSILHDLCHHPSAFTSSTASALSK